MKLATWNINSIRARIDLLADWLRRADPDVLCLQETKVVDEMFPVDTLAELGYSAAFSGEKSYNGVAILTRGPLTEVRSEFPLSSNADCRLITGVYEGLRVYCAYFPNGRVPHSEHFHAKLQWIDGLGDLIFGARSASGADGEPVALLGDFNVAPEPRDVYDVKAMEGQIHFTVEERTALTRLLDRGFVDAFRICRPEPGLYSWWDYRQGAFRRNLGLRIDHAWVSAALGPRVGDASIDVDERRKERASDHAPLTIEIAR